MKKNKILIIIAIVSVLAILLGSSYAYLRVERKGSDQNISIANFGLVIKQDMKAVTLDKEVPKSDEEGLKNSPNIFIIKNEGDVAAKYQVSLIDTTPASTMSNLDIRYRLKRTRSTASSNPETLEVKSLELNGLLDEGVIAPSEEITYELIIWINHDANPNGLTYKKVLSLEGFQADTLDTSGANPPEMLSNMIPVYYSPTNNTEGVWKVADITNRDTNYKWYDYNDFMWANAVTVKETNGTLNDDGTMTFDGVDDYLDLGYKDYDFKNNITMVLRMKFINTEIEQRLFLNHEAGGVGLIYKDNNLKFSVYIDGVGYIEPSASMTDNSAWHTIIGSYDGEYVRLFIDGKEASKSNQIIGNIKTSIAPFMLGANPDENGKPVDLFSNIIVSDAFIYTDALTDDEIEKYFKGEITDYPKDNLLVEKTEFNELDARQKYLEASVGTEIPMDDISSMWVWIPRYKYTIFNGNNETVNEQMINVEFERGIENTGTVSCRDDILTDDDSDHSEICEDKTNNGIVNGVSTYTHPAFTFGSEELVGFWFAKFEMSTDDKTCINSPSIENCSKTELNLYTKPDEVSYRYSNDSNLFVNIRSMELYNNIHGFLQDKKATSVFDASGNLTGTIPNDTNNYDIHMIKNMEWGAVAYLTMSKYGKYGNPLYQNEYKEIYQNNYKPGHDIPIYKTGYSGKVPNAYIGTEGVLYNNLTIEEEGQGYIGAGASTTGTVYGIYDMSGGYGENVMAATVTKSGIASFDGDIWTSKGTLEEKYYDKYSYNSNTDLLSKEAHSRMKLGDATKEVVKKFSEEQGTGAWYNDYNYAVRGWCTRGIEASGHPGVGIFAYWGAVKEAFYRQGSRPILVISREFPWKK